MRSQPRLCPVHDYARKHCNADCRLARLKLRALAGDYRQYWYDRARGVRPMSARVFALQHTYVNKNRPLWPVWDVA